MSEAAKETDPPDGHRPSVLLVQDSSWPSDSGTCCWRESVAAAFADAGATTRPVAWDASPGGAGRAGAAASAARRSLAAVSERLPGRRTALRAAERVARPVLRAAGRSGRLSRGDAAVPPPSPGPVLLSAAAAAGVVVAEGVEVARAATAARTGDTRVWAFVLPPERPMPGQPTDWADPLRAAFEEGLAGLVTDSQPARDSLERALSPLRVPIVVLPPLAADRPCPSCRSSSPAPSVSVVVTAAAVPVPPAGMGAPISVQATVPPAGAVTVVATVPDEVSLPEPAALAEDGEDAEEPATPAPPVSAPEQLLFWRTLLDEAAEGVVAPRPWSFPLSRLCGEQARYPDASRDSWGEAEQEPLQVLPEWSAAGQLAGARTLLEASAPAPAREGDDRSVAVIGYDLKFIRELVQRLEKRGGLDITLDEWSGPSKRNAGVTHALAAEAQTLVAEWIRPNAAYLSQVKKPGQYLVARLHRFELDSEYPAKVDIDAVDAVVYISPLLGRRIRDELGWPVEKLVYIPNFVDVDWLDRPKYPDARFTVGLAGAIPSRKRLDYALDVIAAVRARDPRFALIVRTQPPWEEKYTWREPEERLHFQRCFERIDTDPLLRGAVTLDFFGRDIAAWLRRTGHVLSTADAEGAPVSVSEGMASAAVPVVRPWPGARDLYGNWIAESVEEAAERILESADPKVWQERAARARVEARRTFDPVGVMYAWEDLLHGRREQAKAHFAQWRDL